MYLKWNYSKGLAYLYKSMKYENKLAYFYKSFQAGKHVPKTPPHYEDNRTLVRKTPLPTVNLNHLFLWKARPFCWASKFSSKSKNGQTFSEVNLIYSCWGNVKKPESSGRKIKMSKFNNNFLPCRLFEEIRTLFDSQGIFSA